MRKLAGLGSSLLLTLVICVLIGVLIGCSGLSGSASDLSRAGSSKPIAPGGDDSLSRSDGPEADSI